MTIKDLTGWTEGPLSDYCEVRKGLTYSTSDYGDKHTGHPFITLKCIAKNGGFSYEGLKFFKNPINEQFNLYPGDLLFANTDLTRDGDVVGSAMLLPKLHYSKPPLFSMDLSKVIQKQNKSDKRYLYYLLSTQDVKKHMVRCSAGSTVLHLNVGDAVKLKVKIPPLQEQQKIAEILTSVDEVIENTQSQINKLEDLKKATMNELLTKGIGHTEFKETEIGRVPKSWKVICLSEIAKFSGGSAFSESLQGYESGDFPFIKVSDMNHQQNTFWIHKSQNWISDQIQKSEKIKLFPRNTIVFAKVGAALMLNRRRILTQSTAIDNNMMGAIAKGSDFMFLFWLLSSIDFKKIVQDGAVPSINQSQLDEIKVAIPDLNEQRNIARILTEIHEISDLVKGKLSVHQHLKQSLMQDLLTGKVRVTVN